MSQYKYLNRIDSPTDLKRLNEEELPELCREIRTFLLDALSRNPGHLGAGLGVVELTVAIHYVFDLPHDKLVWDVGHQAYPHKLLTGRRESFDTLRKWGGLSGFTHPNESEYDAFVAGHASNSISAALGLAVADRMAGRDNQVIAVIGDGAMTGGLAFEGLNNACTHPNNLLIILNDNNISIDKSTGALSRYLVDIITSKTYNKVRHESYKTLKSLNLIDDRRRSSILRFNNSVKALLSDRPNLFEGFSIRYIGPIDGHDVKGIIRVLRDIKDFDGPKLLHVQTVKGKGYKPAEESAVVWHAPGCFDVETGEIKAPLPAPDEPMKFQDVFGHTLVELAEMDERIVGVTPAMPSGCSMTYLMEKYPGRSFDVGIAEGHAVTFSAGLALQGAIPFCNIYSSFMQRGYDQIIHDTAMQSAPVIFCLDRGGLVGEDGMTHHGLYDIAYLRCIPGLTIMSPYDEEELRMMMYTAYKHHKEGPFVIRYPRGKGSCAEWRTPFREVPIGKAEVRRQGSDIAFVSYGPVGNEVSKVVQALSEKGYDPGHINLRFVKPLDRDTILEAARSYKHIVTVEDGTLMGGMGSAILELLSEQGLHLPVSRWGVADEYIKQGKVEIQHKYCGLDADTMQERALEILTHKGPER